MGTSLRLIHRGTLSFSHKEVRKMPAREAPPLGAPCWIELSSADTERSRDFYAALFGWTYEMESAEYGEYASCSLNGTRVAGMTQTDSNYDRPHGCTPYFSSAAAAATAEL